MVAISLAIVLPFLGYMGWRSYVFSGLPDFLHENAAGQRFTAQDGQPPRALDPVHSGTLLPDQPNVAVESNKTDAGSSERLGIRAIRPSELSSIGHARPGAIWNDLMRADSNSGARGKEPGFASPDRKPVGDPLPNFISFEGPSRHAAVPAAALQYATSSEADRGETARLLAVLLDSGRVVLGKAQSTINNPRLDDKGFSSSVFGGRLRKEFLARTGHDLHNLAASAMPEPAKPLLLNLSSLMQKAVHDVQPEINKKGIGFKGFIPATFGTKVAESFSKETGVKIRQIGPPDNEPRNPNNKPDDQEEVALLAIQRSHPRVGDHVVEQRLADNSVRVLLPLFYTRSCLGCHGKPKGETDISGYEKEGFKEGDLGGAISVLFPETGKLAEQVREE